MRNASLATRKNSCNLKFRTIQKMIHRLLTQERIKTKLDAGRVISHYEPSKKLVVRIKPYTKEELAEKFGISLEEFEKLKSLDLS